MRDTKLITVTERSLQDMDEHIVHLRRVARAYVSLVEHGVMNDSMQESYEQAVNILEKASPFPETIEKISACVTPEG